MKSLSFKNHITLDPDDLSEPALNDPEIESQFAEICKKIAEEQELETINLRGNWLSEHQLKTLATVLKSHKQLVFLDLDYNRIGTAAIPYLKQIIKDHPLLTHMNLCHNEIDDNALQALLTDENLEYVQRIKSINFRFYSNKITEKGIDFAFDKVSLDTIETAVAFNKVKEELEDNYYKKIEHKKDLLMRKSSPPVLYSAAAMINERTDEKINSSESKSPQKPSAC